MATGFDDAILDQARASDPRVSAWVSANAGTGKTHVLTQRVIRLLLSGTDPQRILCLTFTKAAASEMARRLFKDLGEWSTLPDDVLIETVYARTREQLSPDDLPKARRLFAQALETPGGLKIQTIHAFCERLLGRFPLEAQVAPNFDVLDDRTAGELLDHARFHVFEKALEEEGTPLAQAHTYLVTRLAEETFDKLFYEVVQKRHRLQWFFDRHGGVAGAVTTLAHCLDLSGGDDAFSIMTETVEEPYCDLTRLESIRDVLRTGTAKTERTQAERMDTFLCQTDLETAFEHYTPIFLTQTGAPRADRGFITKAFREEHPDVDDFMSTERARVARLYEKLKAVRIIEASTALFTLAEEFIQLYAQEKRQRAALDYDDLILATRNLLQRSAAASWVLYKLDGGLDHILVDEAQDTSPYQWDVIKALAAEFFSGLGVHEEREPKEVRTIFAVGDEKQSIYSFQGADPDKFHEESLRFHQQVTDAGYEWARVAFQLSFRSTDVVLRAVDVFFSDEAQQKSLTASGEPIRHLTNRDGHAGLVELWPLIEPRDVDEEDPWDAPIDWVAPHSPPAELAHKIATTIKHWLESGECLHSQGRPIAPGDIMILLRNRGALMEPIIRALKDNNIPVAGADRMHVTEQLAVMDLTALTEFVLQPGDDLSLACVLKSPLVGLTEDELFELAYGRTGSLWQALKARRREKPYDAAYAYLSHMRSRADFVSPFEFYQDILDGAPLSGNLSEQTGRQRLLTRLGQDANDPLDEFLNLALVFEETKTPSLQGFIHWLGSGEAELKREQDQGEGRVRVMTVHGAKGLASNIVMLPDTCGVPDPRQDDHLLTGEDDMIMWRPPRTADQETISEAWRTAYQQKKEAEYHRLLYVAATRARDRLYIGGYQKATAPKDISWYKRIERELRPLADEVTAWDGTPVLRLVSEQTAPPEASTAQDIVTQVITDMPEWVMTSAMPEPMPQQPLAPSRLPLAQEGESEPPVLSPLAADQSDRFRRGHLIHKLLEVLPNLPSDQWRDAVLRFLTVQASDFDEAQRHTLLTEILAILNDTEFAALFAPGSQAEVALAGMAHGLSSDDMDDVIVSGFIDRLCVTDTEVMIVDYKTNRPPPKSVDTVPIVYLRQMAVYRALLREIYPNHRIRCALLWTDGPLWMPLPDALLDRSLAR